MNCDNYKMMINAYADNEMDKSEEAFLFTHLSGCEECRTYFKSLSLVSSGIVKEEFPRELEERIFISIKNKQNKRTSRFFKIKFFPAISYAAAAVLLVVSLLLYSELNNYKNMMVEVSSQVKNQTQTIEMLYNSLPPTVVQATYHDAVIVKAKM